MSIKTIGRSGQVSLGKKHAGRTVLVEEVEEGVWTVKLGEFIPDNERWLLDPEVSKDLDEAIAWAESTPRSETDLDDLKERLERGEEAQQARSA
jgi:hypothetical protein